MVRTITLIPVASDQLHSHWRYSDGPDFDSFAVIMSKFLRSRSLAVSEKILTNSDQRRRREGSVTLESGHLHKTSDICMTWSQAAQGRGFESSPSGHTCDTV